MQYQSFEGEIIEIKGGTQINCKVKYSDETILLKLHDTIPMVHGRSFNLLIPNNLKVGLYIKVFVKSQDFELGKDVKEFMPTILVVNEVDKFFAVTIGQYNDETNMLGNELLTRIDENAIISNSTELLKYEEGIFKACEVAAFYKICTLSIPPKATPQLWIILEK